MNYKHYLLITAGVFSLLFVSIAAHAIGTWDSGYQINHGGGQADVYVGAAAGPCHQVSNSHASNDYFVPSNTQAEWDAFFANQPAGVAVGSCVVACISGDNCTWSGTCTSHCTGLGCGTAEVWTGPGSNLTGCSSCAPSGCAILDGPFGSAGPYAGGYSDCQTVVSAWVPQCATMCKCCETAYGNGTVVCDIDECNEGTIQCDGSCGGTPNPKPNGTLCTGGTCQGGSCSNLTWQVQVCAACFIGCATNCPSFIGNPCAPAGATMSCCANGCQPCILRCQ